MTSFFSLNAVKKALGTGKVGHTGTLDSFADGLLVVLSGALTHLVPYITEFDKSYRAVIAFGAETDTLDPSGTVTAEAGPPSYDRLLETLPLFTGALEQIPPVYSAVHIGGRRASDEARSGRPAELPARSVTVNSLTLKSYAGGDAHISVSCSKGTYIRSLARDIARACGSRAHLRFLRRTRVGPFYLEDAVGADLLPTFPPYDSSCAAEVPRENILASCMPFTPRTAHLCGFQVLYVSDLASAGYRDGKPLESCRFTDESGSPLTPAVPAGPDPIPYAVFYSSGEFGGIIQAGKRGLSYGFVVHPQEHG